jgi:hypothetical protein
MKALKINNNKPYLAGTILAILLMVSPVLAFSNTNDEGKIIVVEDWMTQAFEIVNTEIDGELRVEEWMTQTFEAENAGIDEELRVEEWMTQTFEAENAGIDEELRVEEWMTRDWP